MTKFISPSISINDTLYKSRTNDSIKMSSSLTYGQSIAVGIGCGTSSSLINHPFQVLRARYQNSVAIYNSNPTRAAPAVITFDPRILFKGFTATLLGMWCMTITQSVSKTLYPPSSDISSTQSNWKNVIAPFIPSILGGFWSAAITTPLEGTILRQSKTTSNNQQLRQQRLGTFQSMKLFIKEHGIRRAYHGGLMIGIRTTIVGSAFSIWTPTVAKAFEESHYIKSTHTCTVISGMIVGTVCATLSQPFESIRIEQQFTADTKHSQNLIPIRKATTLLMNENSKGLLGLFKGGSYRIPRTAPGVVINAVVYNELETYIQNQNQYQHMHRFE
jgi:Mitochondrial carrier protein